MDILKVQHKGIIYLLFSLSGFCALVYEVLWTKYLSLTFGTTMIAVSIVAATFMAGLAIGSYLLGKFADHETNLLRIYAYLELGIAIFALLFPPTLKAVSAFHAGLEQLLPSHPASNYFSHLFFATMLLVPPTVCMGGTFPLMCRFFARKKSGGQIGRLYAMNTIGATLGAFGAGYCLIPLLGLSTTNMLAVFINLAIAAISWHFSKTIGTTLPADISQATRADQLQLARDHRPVLVAIALIGFFSLAYEILWTRVFLLFLGNTSYAFSLMLSSYLIGIALGGAIYARKIHSDFDKKKLFVRLTVLMGLSILVTVPFYDQLAHVFQWAHEASGERWWHLSLLSGIIVFSVMCVPTIISGSLLPAAIAIIDPGKVRTGEGVGLVVLHNTIGAVFGCLVAGFVLIPSLGTQSGFQLLAVLNILLGTVLCFIFTPRSFRGLRHPITVACILVPLLVFLPTQWNQKLMNSAVYVYASKYQKWDGISRTLQGENLLEVIEGIDTTVAIKEYTDGSVRYFSVNGKTDGSNGTDMGTQILIGQIPLLLHPDPKQALVIGLGTGITLGGVNDHRLDEIDCAEISPGVVKASVYFEKENKNALRDPRVRLHIEDGRNLILTHNKKYDVIISQPSNPWQSGNANLFTSDFYELSAKRLKDDGIFCQWIGLYDITTENLRIAVNTFLKTYPNTLAFNSKTDMILIGGAHDLTIDYLNLEEKLKNPRIKKTLDQLKIHTAADLIAKHFMFSDKTLRHFSKESRINSDDLPILEYSFKDLLGGKMLGSLLKQNATAMFSAHTGERIPLTNLGLTSKEKLHKLNLIGQAFMAAGRKKEAEYFLDLATKKIPTNNELAQIETAGG